MNSYTYNYSFKEEFIPTNVVDKQMPSVSSSFLELAPKSKRGRKRKHPEDAPRRKYVLTEEERLLVNAKEKERTKITNQAFNILKSVVPSLASDKLTKSKTLDIAIKYIKFLINIFKMTPTEDNRVSYTSDVQEVRRAFALHRIEEQELRTNIKQEPIDQPPQFQQNYFQPNFMY